MNCPKCGDVRSRVFETVPVGDRIRRRRECKGCKHRFSTVEVMADGLNEPKPVVEELSERDRIDAALPASMRRRRG